jgi:hypothetical protein
MIRCDILSQASLGLPFEIAGEANVNAERFVALGLRPRCGVRDSWLCQPAQYALREYVYDFQTTVSSSLSDRK